MKHKLLLILFVFSCSFAIAQPAGWSYVQTITVTNSSATAVTNYQMPLIINTQALISANQMQANGNDIRFGADCAGATLLPHYIDTGINTNATRIWVKLDIAASASRTIYLFYGNSTAATASNIGIFNGPFSSTNQVTGGTAGGVGNSQRGFRFSPNVDILVAQLGKNEPTGTTRYVTIFNYTTQAIVRQGQVSGTAGVYTYNNLTSPVWLTSGTQYTVQLFQGASDGYYFGTSSQINSNLTYYDMLYCNSCTQNTFPTSVLTNYHYGYPDFNFYTRNIVTPAPTYVMGGSGGGAIATKPKDTTVCLNDTAKFFVTVNGNPSAYQWQVYNGTGWSNLPNSAPYFGANTATLKIFPATMALNATRYRIQLTGACGSGVSDSALLTITTAIAPTVSITVSPSASICGSGVATFSATNTYGGVAPLYQWKKNGVAVLGATNATYSSANFANGDVVTVTLTSSISCAVPATVTSNGITLGVQPPTGNTTISLCQFEQAPALTAVGTGLKWYTTPTGGNPLPAAPVPVTTVPGTYSYYVSQTQNGCESPRLTITTIVKPKPAPPTVRTPIVYCQYDAAQAFDIQGQNLKWYQGPSGGQGATFTPVPNTQYEDTTDYWVSQTVNGCESDRTLIQVMVYQKPNGIILSTKPFVCQYDVDTLYYFGNARPIATVDWKAAFKKATIIQQIGRDTIVVRFDSAGKIPIRMQVNTNGCVSDEFILNVDVRPVPIVRIATKDKVCLDEVSVVSLDYATPGISNYIWNFGGGNQIYGDNNTAGPYGITWPAPGLYTISIKATANECTSPAYKKDVEVRQLPDATIGHTTPLNICTGDSIKLTAGTKQDGTYTYLWTPELFFNNGYGANPKSDEVMAYVLNAQYVHLQVIDTAGCKGSDSLLVNAEPCCDLVLPDAFTPNGDGRNDIFRIITKGHHKISTFRVQNRWAVTVFETADETRGWDGTFSGVPQDGGTYYYYVRYQCQNKKYYEVKGEVTLIR